MHTARSVLLVPALLALLLGGCDLFDSEDPAKVAAAKEADAKAIGAACRHSGRGLEDCYVMNPKALKSSVYSGWLEMDGYMRDNKLQAVVPDLVDPPTGGKAEAPVAADNAKAPAAKADAGDEKKPAAEAKKKAVHKGSSSFLPPSTAERRRSA
jgi:hypothetical protein